MLVFPIPVCGNKKSWEYRDFLSQRLPLCSLCAPGVMLDTAFGELALWTLHTELPVQDCTCRVLSFRLGPNTGSLLFQVIEILLKWHGSIKLLLEATIFPFPPSFPLKSGKFTVSKCLFSFRCFWESKANTVQYFVTGIYEAFLKYWFLTPCEPFCLRNVGNSIPLASSLRQHWLVLGRFFLASSC